MADCERPIRVADGSFGVKSSAAGLPTAESLVRKHFLFLSCVVLSVMLYWTPLRGWAQLSMRDFQYSHLVLIPLVSGLLIYWERQKIFAETRRDGRPAGLVLMMAAIGVYLAGWKLFISSSSTDHISIMILSLVLAWTGAYVACYGLQSFRRAAFPLLFLLLMIPLPDFLLSRIVLGLQHGSAVATYVIFKLVGVPAYRNGLIFALPGFRIEIAAECSGIRSSMALMITALLASHFFLRTYWKKTFLIAFIVPLVVVKNALRIATLSLLSVYVNRGFLTGNLHHYGGIPFSIVSVGILLPVLWLLQKSENRVRKEKVKSDRSGDLLRNPGSLSC